MPLFEERCLIESYLFSLEKRQLSLSFQIGAFVVRYGFNTILNFAQECLLYNIFFFLLRRPFVSNLYEVVSVDINYFFQYGQEVWYKANHKRAEQTYKAHCPKPNMIEEK